jgi:hypothetical protein
MMDNTTPAALALRNLRLSALYQRYFREAEEVIFGERRRPLDRIRERYSDLVDRERELLAAVKRGE